MKIKTRRSKSHLLRDRNRRATWSWSSCSSQPHSTASLGQVRVSVSWHKTDVVGGNGGGQFLPKQPLSDEIRSHGARSHRPAQEES